MEILKNRKLGSTDCSVSRLSFGGGGLGNFFRLVSDEQAADLLACAWAAGINYFDTAPFYGRGKSERRLGAFLSNKPRSDYCISTKVGRILTPARGNLEEDGIFFDLSPFNSHYDYSYDGVMRSHEDSLHRLGVDRIDFLYVHDIGDMIHSEVAEEQLKTLQNGGLVALEELRAGGNISGYGLGVNEIEACRACLDYGDPDAFLLAGRFTLLEQTLAIGLMDRCIERDVSIVLGGVYNSGILATGSVPSARYNYDKAPADIIARVKAMEAVCDAYGISLSSAALQFPFTHPAVATVLLGVGSMPSLERNLQAMKVNIPSEFWTAMYSAGLLDEPVNFAG